MRAAVLLIAAVAAGLSLASAARPVSYKLPADEVPRELAQADAELVRITCAACHSLDYLTTQPRGKGAQFWRDSVTKMITAYGAPIAPAEVEPLVEVLNARLGGPPSR